MKEQVSTQLTETVGQEPDAVVPGRPHGRGRGEDDRRADRGVGPIDVAVHVTKGSDGNAELDIPVADEITSNATSLAGTRQERSPFPTCSATRSSSSRIARRTGP